MAKAKRKRKFKMECARYITDFRGREISPGNVIAVSRSGRGSRKLQAYIVTAVRKKTVTLAGMNYKYDFDYSTRSYTKVFTGVRPSSSRSDLFKGEIQQHLIVIDNPLYAIHNPQMEEIIEVADGLKSNGIFPKDYKLGKAVIEYQEESDEQTA